MHLVKLESDYTRDQEEGYAMPWIVSVVALIVVPLLIAGGIGWLILRWLR